MSFPTVPVIRYTSITIWCTFFILSTYITKREISVRWKYNSFQKHPLFPSKYTKIFTLLSMILSCISLLFGILAYVPKFCIYGLPLALISLTAAVTFFGYYQLARLYYCFSQNQVHSNHGYSNKLFIFMYSLGFFCEIDFIIFAWLSTKSSLDNSGFCRFRATALFWSIVAIPFVYYVWDWTILGMYVYKIRQFNKLSQDSNKKKVFKRVKYILSKIILLTLFVEVFNALNAGIVVTVVLIENEVIYRIMHITVALISGICSSILCWVVYCIMEHNEQDYMKMLKLLEKMICFRCCKNFILNATPLSDGDQLKEQEMRQQTKDTKTVGLPRQLSPNAISEYTQTQTVYA